MLMPLLPRWINKKIIEKEWYLIKFKPPLILNIFLKFIGILVNNRAIVYFGIIKSITFFAKYSFLTKLKYRFHLTNETT